MGGTEPPSTTVYDFVPIEKHAETTPSGIEEQRGIRPETVQQVGGMVGRIMDSVRDFIGAMAWGPPVPEPIVTRFKRKTPHEHASDDNA
ncbi:hypothetical protein Q1695_003802 [Nippostrongylus brasiliensis]|nr:hypothetical protein Q1695_003802 [Nippostrongylus brasiliensis]